MNRELSIVRRAFNLAVKDGRFLHRPYVPMVSEDNARQGFFTPDQFAGLRKRLPETLRGMVTFAYLTGWRIPSEVLTLTWAQVDLKAKTVRLEPGTTKNRRGRTVDFSEWPELAAVLTARRAYTDAVQKSAGCIIPLVFHRAGRPIRDFRKAWDTACTAAGCPGRIPHDLRRSAVRDLVRSGVPQTVAMKITGHLTDSVFRRDDITSAADLRDAGRLRSQRSG